MGSRDPTVGCPLIFRKMFLIMAFIMGDMLRLYFRDTQNKFRVLSLFVTVSARNWKYHFRPCNVTFARVTGPERPKGAKDEVKQAKRAQSRGSWVRSRGVVGPSGQEVGSQSISRLLVVP